MKITRQSVLDNSIPRVGVSITKIVTGSGSDVVVLHDALANADDMQTIANEVAIRHKAININLPGRCGSMWNDSIQTIHDLADYILAELPPCATYLAWSAGGLVAQSIAARYPARVKHIIGVCTTPKFLATDGWIGIHKPGLEALIMPIIEKDGLNAFVRSSYDAEFSEVIPNAEIYRRVISTCNNRQDIQKPIIKKMLQMVDAADLRNEFKTISCPIDLIMGEHDTNIPRDAFMQIENLNKHVKIHEIKGASHLPFYTHSKEFNQLLHKLLKKVQ